MNVKETHRVQRLIAARIAARELVEELTALEETTKRRTAAMSKRVGAIEDILSRELSDTSRAVAPDGPLTPQTWDLLADLRADLEGMRREVAQADAQGEALEHVNVLDRLTLILARFDARTREVKPPPPPPPPYSELDDGLPSRVEPQVVLEPCGTVVAVFRSTGAVRRGHGARPLRFNFGGPPDSATDIALELAKAVWADGPFRRSFPDVIALREDEDCYWSFALPRFADPSGWKPLRHGGRFLGAIAFGMAQHLLSIRRTQEPPR